MKSRMFKIKDELIAKALHHFYVPYCRSHELRYTQCNASLKPGMEV